MPGLMTNMQTAPRSVKLEPIVSAFAKAFLQASLSGAESTHGLVPPLKKAVEKAGKTKPLMTVEAVPHTTTSQKAGHPFEHRPCSDSTPLLVIDSVIEDIFTLGGVAWFRTSYY